MTFNQKFSIVTLLLLGLTAQAKSDAAFLSAVAEVAGSQVPRRV